MTPVDAISMLDAQIAEHGQSVVLRKNAGVADDKSLRAFVRGYRPDELSGGIQQGDTNVVLSPTSLVASGFAAPIRRLDKITIDGRLRNVELANAIEIDGVVVRIDLQVRG